MKNKYFTFMLLAILGSINTIQAGCGGCGPRKKIMTKTSWPKDMIMSVPKNNTLNGKVEASCGMCNFNSNDKDCALSIRVGSNVFLVKGNGIDDHGDSHADDGFCNAIRIAEVQGKINKGNFTSKSFTLINQPSLLK